ncbi:MAG: hypothetical protein AB7L84_10650 [Acidimicrobiia bacterium]
MPSPLPRLLTVAGAFTAASALTLACSSDREQATPPPSSASGTPTTRPTTTTMPMRPTSTTSTTYAPDTTEGQVEAAYLRGWDVYADQVWNLELDEAALAEVFADEQLAVTTQEIKDRIATDRASWLRADRSYRVVLVPDVQRAKVIDESTNHQVRVEPTTKEPAEDDPNEVVRSVATMELVDGAWRIARIDGIVE